MNIKQIIPADGWYAKYFTDRKTHFYVKVLCFGILTNDPFIRGFDCEGEIHEDNINFEKYVFSPSKNLEG